MKKVTINAYSFDELSKEAKEKVLSALVYINTEFGDWYESTYEDAERIGLKITGFDVEYRNSCKGEFIDSATYCAEQITSEHGKDCSTYRTAKKFLDDLNELTSEHENIADVPEDKIEDLEDYFLASILEDYRIMLQKELEYLTSEEAIKETIEANEYYFSANGKQLPIVTYYKDGEISKHEFNGEDCQIQ